MSLVTQKIMVCFLLSRFSRSSHRVVPSHAMAGETMAAPVNTQPRRRHELQARSSSASSTPWAQVPPRLCDGTASSTRAAHPRAPLLGRKRHRGYVPALTVAAAIPRASRILAACPDPAVVSPTPHDHCTPPRRHGYALRLPWPMRAL